MTCAGSVNQPVPPTPVATGPGGTREVVALLVPFLRPTPTNIANNLLYFYIKYHLELGFSKFVQYTQVLLIPPTVHVTFCSYQGSPVVKINAVWHQHAHACPSLHFLWTSLAAHVCIHVCVICINDWQAVQVTALPMCLRAKQRNGSVHVPSLSWCDVQVRDCESKPAPPHSQIPC